MLVVFEACNHSIETIHDKALPFDPLTMLSYARLRDDGLLCGTWKSKRVPR